MKRVLAAAAISVLAACGGSTPTTPPSTTDNDVFSLSTPELTLGPGEEKTFCYYTKMKNVQPFGVKRFESTMASGSHHLILFTLKQETRPEGTVEECGFPRGGGFGGSRVIPVWTYAAQSPDASIDMPEGVGMTIEAEQHVVIQMHYLNASENTLHPQATVRMRRHTTDEYIRAAPFVSYATNINVAPNSTGEVKAECQVPDGAKFYLASTHSHRFTQRARVLDGQNVIVDTNDWEHPKVVKWGGAPYHTFASGKMTYHCTYNNTSAERLRTGDSARTDEMCMGVGYFFPAINGGRFCFDGAVFPF